MVNFSVAELVYAVAIIGLAAYLVYSIWRLIARPEKLWQAYRLLLTAVMAALVFWAGSPSCGRPAITLLAFQSSPA